jgi:hypothetical protein
VIHNVFWDVGPRVYFLTALIFWNQKCCKWKLYILRANLLNETFLRKPINFDLIFVLWIDNQN